MGKMGTYGSGNCNTWNSFNVMPPSGARQNSSRPGFANRFSNMSSGMYSKPCALYDDGMSNRFGNYSGCSDMYSKPCGMSGNDMSNRFGNCNGGMYGSNMGAKYDDGFCGMGMYGSKHGGMNSMHSSNMGFSSPNGGRMY